MKNLNSSQTLAARLFAAALLLASAASALAEVRYADVNSTNATPPFLSWATAATNIQDAVDAAVAGDEIVVTNGIYATGGRAVYGTMTNRMAVDKPLTLRSVNGPEFTVAQGHRLPRANNGDGAIRCVYLTNGASLSGFTLKGGATRAASDPTYRESGGGGLWCESTNAVVASNCVVVGNSAYWGGAGAYQGTLNNCDVSGNSGSGASYCALNNCTPTGNGGRGASSSTLNNCTLTGNDDGGAYSSTLNNCTLTGNKVSGFFQVGGGGAYRCTLNNCTLSSNSVITTSAHLAYGGGAWVSTLNNCTLTDNSAGRTADSPGYGGGAAECTLNNCIVFSNITRPGGPGASASVLNDCWLADPLFVDYAGGNLHLQSNSPCINAGNNSYVTSATDLDGNPRIAGGTVDIGAYEFQSPASIISYAWLQQFNLPINPATNTADPDGDGVNNYGEWLAHSDPTNPFSFPPLLTLTPYGANVILTWPTNAVGFTLQSTTNLGSPVDWITNSLAPVVIGGQNVVINPVTGPQQFYRLRQ